MKAWLSHVGVPFNVRNVMTDDAAYERLRALGYRRVPVTVIGDVVIQGYDRDALEVHTRRFRGEPEQAGRGDTPSE